MNVTRLWAVISALLIVVGAALGCFVSVQPQLGAAATANELRAGVENQNGIHPITLARLTADAVNLAALQETLTNVRLSIPVQANLSTFLQQLSDLAAGSEVTVASFTAQDALGLVAAPEIAETIPASITQEQFIVIPVQMEIVGPRATVLDVIERV